MGLQPIFSTSVVRASTWAGAVLVCLVSGACTGWRSVRHYDRWTLYERPEDRIRASEFEDAFEPAFVAVETALGPFEDRVRVHAWEAEGAGSGGESQEGVQEVPGIGPARIQAYHARGAEGPLSMWSPGGVFIGVAEAGTAVHELVHARLAEEQPELPLWFEEGVASLLGDGVLFDGAWTIDGLSYWPLRELREESLDDATLEHLLDLEASDRASVRDNVLVHFVGWAVLFDLYVETGVLDWRIWYERFDHAHPVRDVRARLERTLDPKTPLRWLERLEHPDPAVRLAAAKGSWKLRSNEVLELLQQALEVEEDAEVRVGLAVNTLAAAGEVDLGWRAWRAILLNVLEALGDAELADSEERHAAIELYRAYRDGEGKARAQWALGHLTRFWEE